ncbi:MAG: D-aminoacyl-tRNA deacylase, partial [Geodermatophilaceae bacterium]|nr:D-aminoacyl-tRNA deacylase [Geodermatophilaceae bacterium]
MRAVLQRVTSASVAVGEVPIARIGAGLLALVGVTHTDTSAQAGTLARGVAGPPLRATNSRPAKVKATVMTLASPPVGCVAGSESRPRGGSGVTGGREHQAAYDVVPDRTRAAARHRTDSGEGQVVTLTQDIDTTPLRDSRATASTMTLSTDLVRVYLNTIGKTKLLTAEQEVDLAKRIEAGLYADRLLADPENSFSSARRRD